ncbi:hypothetical protein [Nocardia sp. NBC_01388]|uniref:hypothetical protein n=1 Tax=Nocardia sp. NBC_01388 TaxID=2903596 RepID=UPI002F90751F
MAENPMAARSEFVAARAARLGYRLVQGDVSADQWALFDAEDGEPVRTALPLADVERWLNQ